MEFSLGLHLGRLHRENLTRVEQTDRDKNSNLQGYVINYSCKSFIPHAPGANVIKKFWSKFTHFFKLDHFMVVNIFYLLQERPAFKIA